MNELIDFINKSRDRHLNLYDYSLVDYVNSSTVVKIICPTHGEFLQKPSTHIKGSGCLRCSLSKKRPNRNSNTNKFIESAQKIHGNKYDYSKVNYSCNRDNVIIICHIHGEFSQKANSHLNGYGCKECGKDIIRSLMKERQVINKLNLIKDFTKVHGDRYDYSEFKYIDCKKTKSTIICKQHGKFLQTYYSHKKGSGCPSCNTMSKAQKDLLNYLTNIYDGIILYNYYPSWLEGKELDIYIPEFKLAIEYNGVIYHHSGIEEKDCYGLNRYSVNSDYHLNKYQSCKTNRY
jgi:hypothetical protein